MAPLAKLLSKNDKTITFQANVFARKNIGLKTKS
jgi:hypothetical protein